MSLTPQCPKCDARIREVVQLQDRDVFFCQRGHRTEQLRLFPPSSPALDLFSAVQSPTGGRNAD
jgi:hypothetical protein